jgi:hypothetical protein
MELPPFYGKFMYPNIKSCRLWVVGFFFVLMKFFVKVISLSAPFDGVCFIFCGYGLHFCRNCDTMEVRIFRISPILTDLGVKKSVRIGEIRKIRTSIVSQFSKAVFASDSYLS